MDNCFIQYEIVCWIFTFRLKDTMEGFLERQNLPEFRELEHFPDDLLMCYVINTWKEIVLYQNQVEHY